MTNPYQVITNSPQNSGLGDPLFDASEKINDNFALLADKLLWGNGSPEGIITANVGTLYEDRINGIVYIKRSGAYNTGWISSTAVTKADLPTDTVYEAELEVVEQLAKDRYTKNAINSSSVDANGNSNILSYSSNNVVFDTDPSVILTDYAGTTETLSSIANLAIPTSPVSSTWNNFLGTDGSTETYTQAVYGKDLLVDFSQGNANDNYGLHNVTVTGSPTFTGNKLNQVGNSGIVYSSINTFGSSFCYQFKFKSTNTTTVQTLLGGNSAYSQFVQKGTDNKLVVYLSSTASSHNIVNGLKGTKSDWAVGTEYYLRFRFTGTQYLVDWSLDGTNWTNDFTASSTLGLYTTPLTFGLNSTTLTQPLIGTMDDIQVAIGSPTCAIKNKHLTQKATPLYPVANDTWYDTSVETPVMKKYDGSAWQAYAKVPCGQAITNASGAITSVVQPSLNSKQVTTPSHTRTAQVVETYVNGTSWYRKYSDGWIEQGGRITASGTVNFITPFTTTNYFIGITRADGGAAAYTASVFTFNTGSFVAVAYNPTMWKAEGY